MTQEFLQSKYWRNVKENLGNKTYMVQDYFFQTTKLPFLKKNIGYMPRVDLNNLDFNSLYSIAKKANCINIIIDPINIREEFDLNLLTQRLNKEKINYEINNEFAVHLPKTLEIDVSMNEEELLAQMKPKHRYNLKLAIKKGVEVTIDDKEESFNIFLNLYKETSKRQNYFGRGDNYLKTVWKTYKKFQKDENIELIKIATARYNEEVLASWMLIIYKDTIYYPYGGSSESYKNLMAPFAMVWEIIKFGKSRGLKKLDLFGINDDLLEGYSRFKIGFGGKQIRFVDTISVIIDRRAYVLYKFIYKLRKRFKFN